MRLVTGGPALGERAGRRVGEGGASPDEASLGPGDFRGCERVRLRLRLRLRLRRRGRLLRGLVLLCSLPVADRASVWSTPRISPPPREREVLRARRRRMAASRLDRPGLLGVPPVAECRRSFGVPPLWEPPCMLGSNDRSPVDRLLDMLLDK